ncbi:MAG: dihydrofolate reductase [Clostridiales bacterium]|nr:dihydrofolate reductase [Clostridiales bacterium]
MKIIVAVTKNWGIGCRGNLLFNIPEDMKFFRETTLNKIVIMGHNTLKSMPNGKPLKDRVNIVISADNSLEIDGAIVCNSVSETLEKVKDYNTDDVFVIGGQTVYEQFLDYCKIALITKIEESIDADTFFPNIDEMPNWRQIAMSGANYHEDIKFRFTIYENSNLMD